MSKNGWQGPPRHHIIVPNHKHVIRGGESEVVGQTQSQMSLYSDRTRLFVGGEVFDVTCAHNIG